MRIALAAASAMALSLAIASDAGAQPGRAPAPGDDWASFGLDFGLFSPVSTFHDDSYGESRFERAGAVAASATMWPLLSRRVGIRAKILRSHTDATNETSELAPLAVNDPTQWLFTGELVGRYPLSAAGIHTAPYLSAGAGMKQYNWATAVHDEDRFFTWTVAGGVELRPAALGGLGVNLEMRAYGSKFHAFGIDDGTWEPGTRAREGTDIGFYGGVVGGVDNFDLLLTTGLSWSF